MKVAERPREEARVPFQSRPRTGHRHISCSCDLDLDRMALIYEFGLDILKGYLRTENELSRSRLSKVEVKAYRQIDTQTDRQM